MNKDLKKLIKALGEQGYEVTYTANRHVVVRTADGKWVTTMAGTPSDRRGWRNALAALRRSGFIWPVK